MDPTTLYYNPAGMTLLRGTQFASSGFVVFTRSNFENRGSHLNEEVDGGQIPGNSGGNGGGIALLPTFFLTHQFHERVSGGIGVSAPFGLETDWTRGWVGRYHARLSRLQTITVQPSLAVRVTDWLSIGAGADAEWAHAKLNNNLDMGSICQILGPQQNPPVPPEVCTAFLGLQPGKVNGYVNLSGADWSAGYNIGLLFEPSGSRVGSPIARSSTRSPATRSSASPRRPRFLHPVRALKNTPSAPPRHPRPGLAQRLPEVNDLQFLADVTRTHWSLFKELVSTSRTRSSPRSSSPRTGTTAALPVGEPTINKM